MVERMSPQGWQLCSVVVAQAELSDGSCPPLRVHMACASVLQLLESQAFAHMLDSLSPELQHDLQVRPC